MQGPSESVKDMQIQAIAAGKVRSKPGAAEDDHDNSESVMTSSTKVLVAHHEPKPVDDDEKSKSIVGVKRKAKAISAAAKPTSSRGGSKPRSSSRGGKKPKKSATARSRGSKKPAVTVSAPVGVSSEPVVDSAARQTPTPESPLTKVDKFTPSQSPLTSPSGTRKELSFCGSDSSSQTNRKPAAREHHLHNRKRRPRNYSESPDASPPRHKRGRQDSEDRSSRDVRRSKNQPRKVRGENCIIMREGGREGVGTY